MGVLRSPPPSLGSFITLRAVEPDTFTSFIALQQTPHFSLIKPQGHTCATLKYFILFKSEIRKQSPEQQVYSELLLKESQQMKEDYWLVFTLYSGNAI